MIISGTKKEEILNELKSLSPSKYREQNVLGYCIQLQFAETGITLVWDLSLFQNLESKVSFRSEDASIAKHGQF